MYRQIKIFFSIIVNKNIKYNSYTVTYCTVLLLCSHRRGAVGQPGPGPVALWFGPGYTFYQKKKYVNVEKSPFINSFGNGFQVFKMHLNSPKTRLDFFLIFPESRLIIFTLARTQLFFDRPY